MYLEAKRHADKRLIGIVGNVVAYSIALVGSATWITLTEAPPQMPCSGKRTQPSGRTGAMFLRRTFYGSSVYEATRPDALSGTTSNVQHNALPRLYFAVTS